MNNSELYHHGIKGMKWGVRRDRKSKGESRYKRGRRLNSEMSKVRGQEYKSLKEQHKAEFDKYYDEASFIAKKYGLDEDDGGGGDTSTFSEHQIENAQRRYMDLVDKADYLDEQISKEAKKKAETYISKTYGDTAVSDIQHYNSVNGIAVTAAFVAAYSALVIAGVKSSKHS